MNRDPFAPNTHRNPPEDWTQEPESTLGRNAAALAILALGIWMAVFLFVEVME